MGKTSAPPLHGKVIRQARLDRFLTQAEVAEQVVALGVKFDRTGLSLIEKGAVKRPHPRVVRALSEVFGLTADEIYMAEDSSGEDGKEQRKPEQEADAA